ncbi:Flavoredoxin [uncultured delta proteobacterium]|uniref:Flavoredoxin n=1 Tax=uncultured delta proteobacterium TaxID=34034 RepID=A0A212K3R0_9DELT|nr:Flavoredoxin [uncultured delta proteobacterium]
MKRSLGPQTLLYPLPAFLVGTYDGEGNANIMTAAWGGVCCSEPPLVAVSVRKERWTYDAILTREAFTLSIPSADQAARVDFAGMASGRKTDKFKDTGFTPARGEFVDAPYVLECPVVVELVLRTSLELGSHVQFIGEVRDVKIEEGCLDADGKPVREKIDPLLYDIGAREYCRVGQSVCKAFSSGKVFLKKSGA